MYKHQTADDWREYLRVPEDYRVDALVVVGTHPKAKEYPHVYEALESLGVSFVEEQLDRVFFSEVKVFVINGKRIWFDVVYGTAYLSEIVHVASLLGSRQNILLGSCGALQEGVSCGDVVLPRESFGNESSTRMYMPKSQDGVFFANPTLRDQLSSRLPHGVKVHDGRMFTVQAMLAETQEDVKTWEREGYVAVDMESATLFAVSAHFKVPCAALLYVADHLIQGTLVGSDSYELLRAQRLLARKNHYRAVFATCFS